MDYNSDYNSERVLHFPTHQTVSHCGFVAISVCHLAFISTSEIHLGVTAVKCAPRRHFAIKRGKKQRRSFLFVNRTSRQNAEN